MGCSPIKAARELGAERRETVRSLSVAGVGNLRGAVLSTRGPGWTCLLYTSTEDEKVVAIAKILSSDDSEEDLDKITGEETSTSESEYNAAIDTDTNNADNTEE